MKTHHWLVCGAVIAMGLQLGDARAESQHRLGLGARYHVAHSFVPEFPYDDGDLTYQAVYEYHEDVALWQLVVGYTPDAGRSNGVDYVIAPQINLLLKDGIWRGGLGIGWDYIRTELPDAGDWSDLYYQFILGCSLPLGSLNLDVSAFYPFAKWDDLSEFEFADIEFGLGLTYSF